METIDNSHCKQELLTNESFEKLSSFYSLFSDPTSLSIICLLCKHELCVNDIATILNISLSRVSHQLATFRRSGIVKCRRSGKEVYYTLDDDHIVKLFEIGLEHINHKG